MHGETVKFVKIFLRKISSNCGMNLSSAG